MNRRRALALVCMAVFLLACTFACLDHHCLGDGCVVCALINQIGRILFIASAAVLTVLLARLCVSLAHAAADSETFISLVSAKVRLND